MSYNITGWETRTLDNLQVNLKDVEKVNPTLPDYIYTSWDSEDVAIELSEQGGIQGELKGGILHIASVRLGGEGSGSAWYGALFTDILKSSLGELLAFIVWEGGNDFNKLHVIDGKITISEAKLC